MWPRHPTKKIFFPDLPLMEGDKVVEYNPDQTQLVRRYTERAVEFIETQSRSSRSFLYLGHHMPHVPLLVSEAFRGKSAARAVWRRLRGGRLVGGRGAGTLKRLKIDERTLVIFFSDNGPWLSYGNHGGSAKPLREGKTTSLRGRLSRPLHHALAGPHPRRPRLAGAGHVDGPAADAGRSWPAREQPKNPIDGKNIWPLMAGQRDAKSPHEAFLLLQCLAAGGGAVGPLETDAAAHALRGGRAGHGRHARQARVGQHQPGPVRSAERSGRERATWRWSIPTSSSSCSSWWPRPARIWATARCA